MPESIPSWSRKRQAAHLISHRDHVEPTTSLVPHHGTGFVHPASEFVGHPEKNTRPRCTDPKSELILPGWPIRTSKHPRLRSEQETSLPANRVTGERIVDGGARQNMTLKGMSKTPSPRCGNSWLQQHCITILFSGTGAALGRATSGDVVLRLDTSAHTCCSPTPLWLGQRSMSNPKELVESFLRHPSTFPRTQRRGEPVIFIGIGNGRFHRKPTVVRHVKRTIEQTHRPLAGKLPERILR